MSPLAAVLAQTLSPWVVLPALLLEWWAIWFTLGRNFTVTSLMTLSANGLSLLAAAFLVFSGALGKPAAAVAPFRFSSLAAAALAAIAIQLTIEAVVLRGLMRKIRPGWSWNGFDLLTFGCAHAASVLLAAWLAHGAASG